MRKFIKPSKVFLSGFTGVLAGAVLTVGIVSATATSWSAGGGVSHFDGTEIYDSQSSVAAGSTCTMSETYVDMPNMSVTFTTSNEDDRAAVFFNAQNSDPPTGHFTPEYTYARLVVDNAVQSGSGAEKIIMSNYYMQDASWQFMTDELPAGSHTAKLQWRIVQWPGTPDPDTSEQCWKDSSMIVLHD